MNVVHFIDSVSMCLANEAIEPNKRASCHFNNGKTRRRRAEGGGTVGVPFFLLSSFVEY